MPAFFLPVSGSLVITTGNVIKGPASSGQVVHMGYLSRSTESITLYEDGNLSCNFGLRPPSSLSISMPLPMRDSLSFGGLMRFRIAFPMFSGVSPRMEFIFSWVENMFPTTGMS